MNRNVLYLIGVVVLGAVLALGWIWAGRSTRVSAESPRQLTIGAERFEFPPGYLRESPDGGAQIAAALPDFTPAADVNDISARTNLDERFQRLVFLTLRPADPQLDPADRMDRLYQRFLSPTVFERPAGLAVRVFDHGSPFEGDELVFVPPEGRAFAARCRRPDPLNKTPATCSALRRQSGLDIEVRFAASHLGEWEDLMTRAVGLVSAARR